MMISEPRHCERAARPGDPVSDSVNARWASESDGPPASPSQPEPEPGLSQGRRPGGAGRGQPQSRRVMVTGTAGDS
jgi:hypothetical protein